MLSITINDGLNSIILNWEHQSVDIMELSKKIEEVCYREFRLTQDALDLPSADVKMEKGI